MFENRLPIAEFDIFETSHDPENPSFIQIKIEQCRAKLTDNPQNNPAEPNCWRYIRQDSKESRNSKKKLLDVSIGPILNVRRNVPLTIHFKNTLAKMDMGTECCASHTDGKSNGCCSPMLQKPPIHPIPAMMSGMNQSVGVAVHLHGGKVPSTDDGWPLSPMSFKGNPYTDDQGRKLRDHVTYKYPNNQRAGMLWFHDHGMDNTAPQVHAGLAGLYFIRDESDDKIFELLGDTDRESEIPLVIQDRVLNCDSDGFDYWAGLPTKNPQFNPDGTLKSIDYQRPEFLGDTIFVNGRPSPHHNVESKRYRLRMLNGSNARTYALALMNPEYWTRQDSQTASNKIWYSDKLTVIGNDGGLFATCKQLAEQDYILLAPGERLDLILDLTDVCPDEVSKLRLVNLAVGSVARGEWPEKIFQSEYLYNAPQNGSIVQPTSKGTPDVPDYQDLNLLLGIKQANILQFYLGDGNKLNGHQHGHTFCDCQTNKPQIKADKDAFVQALDKLLSDYATNQFPEALGSESFKWDSVNNGFEAVLKPQQVEVKRNRLVLLMNNTQWADDPKHDNPYTAEGRYKATIDEDRWHDTQIWEMEEVPIDPVRSILKPFQIPFNVELKADVSNPPKGVIDVLTQYQVARSTFFVPKMHQTDLIGLTKPRGSGFNKQYPQIADASIKPTPESFERWYVANIGNWQPDDTGTPSLQMPDMHPFHIHLVNFIVLNRYALSDNGNFSGMPVGKNHFDQQVRHDTVRINANELVELLVYFPPNPSENIGYYGKYPYHCHLVEHEDMGMMLHFEVVAE